MDARTAILLIAKFLDTFPGYREQKQAFGSGYQHKMKDGKTEKK